MPKLQKSDILLFLVAVCGTAADLVTKEIAQRKFIPPLIIFNDVFSFRFVTNENMIWGLKLLPHLIATLLPVLATPFIVYLYSTLKPRTCFTAAGFGMILAGTFGNLYDRVFFVNHNGINAVRDFISFDIINWPVFNLADVFICVGAGMIAIKILFTKQPVEAEKPM